MYILPQILGIEANNLLVNNLIYTFKNKLIKILDDVFKISCKNKYNNLCFLMQDMLNDIYVSFFKNLFELADQEFRNSNIRSEQYYINKSNVERTIITMFGEITFKRTLYQHKVTKEYYFYVDDVFELQPYKNYDPIIRGLFIQESVLKNVNHAATNSLLNFFHLKESLKSRLSIPKQTVYSFKQEVKIKKIEYEEIPHDDTLYVMVDEKWIHKQDKNEPNKKKWIMSKCFVTFTGIKRKGKRTRLVGRHVFITSSNSPWKEFMEEISNIYNFEKLKNINLLSDAGSWILSGASELRLYSGNKVIINTCEFHVKQKINRSTHDKELRIKISDIIYNQKDKKAFTNEMDKLIANAASDSRKQKITEYKSYILKHWRGIQNMKESLCKSSMEAHIEHCIASAFSEVPKAYSDKNIEQYLKLQEMALNGISIFHYYLNTYNSSDEVVYNQKKADFSMFEKSTSNIPALNSFNPISQVLSGICNSGYSFR